MERKNWVKPMTLVQKFEANETVANNCFLIACESKATHDTDSNAPGNLWKKPEGHYLSGYGWDSAHYVGKPDEFGHGNCQTASNNIFNIDGGNISFEREINGASGDFYGVDGWSDEDQNDVISVGDIVYWYNTDISKIWRVGDRWNHWGHVVAVDPNHPCQS